MNRNPRRKAGDTTGQGRATNPNRRNRRWGALFRVPSFSARRLSLYGRHQTVGRLFERADTGRYAVLLAVSKGWRWVVQSCVFSCKVARSGLGLPGRLPPSLRRSIEFRRLGVTEVREYPSRRPKAENTAFLAAPRDSGTVPGEVA